jgi:cathepsin L
VQEFEKFEKDFDRKYPDQETRFKKFEIFRSNLAYINSHNAKEKKTFTLKVNNFADIHFEEFKSNHLGLDLGLANPETTNLMKLGTHKAENIAVPDSIDWVEKGGVTKVKNQGACGSCWSFSTTGALEGAYFATHGNLVSISEQEFVDCDTQDNGCNGGLMDNAFQYAMSNDLCTEDSYNYHAADGKCKMAKSKCEIAVKKGEVTGFKDVEPHSQQALMEALAQQPVSVAIEADKQVFQFYDQGVLTSSECGTQLDHGVLVVGYGTYKNPDTGEDQKYWKVKNSWGPSWGQDGFLLISRDDNMDDEGNNVGICGIMTLPSYPVLVKEQAQSPVKEIDQLKSLRGPAAQVTQDDELYV